MAGAYLALALAAFLVSRLKYDPIVNGRLFLLGMTLSGLGLVLMTRGDVRLSFLFRVMHEGGDGLMGAFVVLYISRLFEKKTIGGSAGILTALQTSGHMAGSLGLLLAGLPGRSPGAHGRRRLHPPRQRRLQPGRSAPGLNSGTSRFGVE